MNNKKTIFILVLVLFVGIVGLTLAYFANSTSVDNLFTTQPYGTTVTEEFTSPSNWLPGDEVDKTIVATNTGNVDEAVRISLSENWKTANNGTLNGWITENGNKSSHLPENEPSTDERVAIINFDNDSDWEYSNGYYYYKYKLSPNESTSSLIKSVTFNSKTKLDDTCVTTTNGSTKTITCNSSGDDYDNATYTLTFDIETVQYNKYKEAWNINYNIAESKPVATFCVYEIGDEITYDDENYYVIRSSDNSSNYVVALKKDLLTASEVNTYSTDYVSVHGEYPYYISNTCNNNDSSGCSTNYDISNVKVIVDGWSNEMVDDLVNIDGYNARLLNEEDIYDNMTVEVTPSSTQNKISELLIIRAHNNYPFMYWTMYRSDENNEVYAIDESIFPRKVSNYESYEESWGDIYSGPKIRPVINLKKSAIESECPNH